MDRYSNALLNAMDIVVRDRLSGLELDKTIQGEIVSIIDADTGAYRAKYNGNIIQVYARIPEEQYKIGERVYIVVPEGNFDADKIIFGRVERQSLSNNSENSATGSIVEASPTFDQLYDYNAGGKYGVIAGAPIGSSHQTSSIGSWPRSYYHGVFQRYADDYDFIKIQGTFQTEFQSVHTAGNYGLELTFYTNDGGEISYRLDLSSFNGDPYRLVTATPQAIILQVQRNYLYGLKSIVLFEEDFEYDEYLSGGLPSGTYNTDTPNIFVKDLVIQYVERKDINPDTYYLAIATQKGNSFTSSVTNLTLQGKLFFQGKDIYNEKSCTCQWYIQDPSITVASDLYNKNAGVGWRPLTGQTSNLLSLDLDSGLWYKRNYKLIMIYNSRNLLMEEQSVYNLTINEAYRNFYLEQTSENGGLTLQIRDNQLNDLLVGEWYILYPDGKYTQLANGQKRNSIALEDYLIYSSAVVYCTVYTPNGASQLGILDYTITSTSLESDLTVTYQGEDTFRYDANGNTTVEDSEKERYLKPVFAWKEGVYGTGARIEWYDINGNYVEPGGASVSFNSASKSMISDLYVDSNYILHYHIRQKYKDYYDNNTLTLKVVTSGNTYTFKKEILFLKDGDQGTNGTSYICAIRPCETNGTKISGYRPLTYNGSWGSLRLKCYVYYEGDLIDALDSTGSIYGVTYEWEKSGVITISGSTTSAQTLIRGSGSPSGPNYVKCHVRIRDNSQREYVDLYALYPVDIAVGGFTIGNIQMDIPQYVKYTASGLTPLYYNTEVSCTYGAAAASLSSSTPKLLTIDSEHRLKPSPNFKFEDNNIGLIRCTFSSSLYILHSVVMYLNTYGNEAINGWDGTSLNTTDGHILAPQIGAGKKVSGNLFTGVVMGTDTGQSKVGLFGYQAGVNTFGLTEDGIAYFGKSGDGRIVANGTSATIYGGTCAPTSITGSPSPATNGMIIKLSNTSENGSTAAIQIGKTTDANHFKIDYNGKLTCQGATVKGTIQAESGYIGGSGGWIIDTGIIRNTANTIVLDARSNASYAFKAGSNFTVSPEGTLKCSNASISGIINASEGSIGGWYIRNSRLENANGTVYLSPTGIYGTTISGSTIISAGSESTVTINSGSVDFAGSSGSGSVTFTTARGLTVSGFNSLTLWGQNNINIDTSAVSDDSGKSIYIGHTSGPAKTILIGNSASTTTIYGQVNIPNLDVTAKFA